MPEQILTAISLQENITVDVWATIHADLCANKNTIEFSFFVYKELTKEINTIVVIYTIQEEKILTENIVNVRYTVPSNLPERVKIRFRELLRARNRLIIYPSSYNEILGRSKNLGLSFAFKE